MQYCPIHKLPVTITSRTEKICTFRCPEYGCTFQGSTEGTFSLLGDFSGSMRLSMNIPITPKKDPQYKINKKTSYLLNLTCQHEHIRRKIKCFSCDDCGRTVNEDTLEYNMTEGARELSMVLYNDDKEKHKDLISKLDSVPFLQSLSKKKAEKFWNEIL
jgi:hypothetical protein